MALLPHPRLADAAPTRRSAALWFAGLAVLAGPRPAEAKRSREDDSAEVPPTVTLVSGPPCDSSLDMAHDLAVTLAGGRLRVLALVGAGGESNLADVLGIRGVDMGIVSTLDMREAARTELANRLVYIAKLHTAELHVLARPEVKHLTDLDGRAVSLGEARGSTRSMVKPLLDRYGIRYEDRPLGLREAIAAMGTEGGPAATFVLAGKPAPLPVDALRGSGLHLLPVPFDPDADELVYPASLGRSDYPDLVAGEADAVETVAAAMALVAFDWQGASPRKARLAEFSKALVRGMPRLRQPGHHPKWREVNLALEIPGWRRFGPAQEALKRHRPAIAASPAAEPGRGTAPGR